MVEIAVCDYLLANAGVIAIVGTRGYVQNLPQSADFPAFRVQLVDDIETSHLRGGSALRPARVQVDAIGEEDDGVDAYMQATKLAAAIGAALMNQPPFVVSLSDGGSPAVVTDLELKVVERIANPPMFDPTELAQFKVGQDFIIWATVL